MTAKPNSKQLAANGGRLHTWTLRFKIKGSRLAFWRCCYCDYLTNCDWPHTPDGDPDHTCPIAHQ